MIVSLHFLIFSDWLKLSCAGSIFLQLQISDKLYKPVDKTNKKSRHKQVQFCLQREKVCVCVYQKGKFLLSFWCVCQNMEIRHFSAIFSCYCLCTTLLLVFTITTTVQGGLLIKDKGKKGQM